MYKFSLIPLVYDKFVVFLHRNSDSSDGEGLDSIYS